MAALPEGGSLGTLAVGDLVNVRYEYGYDEKGSQTLIRDNVYQTADGTRYDFAARETRFTYDWQGRQLTRTMPLGQTERFAYDAFGRTVFHLDLEGRVTTFVYDDQLSPAELWSYYEPN